MSPHLRPSLVLLCLALAAAATAPALAAPAPFPRAEAQQQEVSLTHSLWKNRPARDTLVIVRQVDWLTCAEAWGIENPPRVDFRTHVLVAQYWLSSRGPVQFSLTPGGDLRVWLERGDSELEVWSRLPAPRLTIRSFRRAEVKMVNGLPLPK